MKATVNINGFTFEAEYKTTEPINGRSAMYVDYPKFLTKKYPLLVRLLIKRALPVYFKIRRIFA